MARHCCIKIFVEFSRKAARTGVGFQGMSLQKISGQASWVFGTKNVKAAVTRLGGHLAPVRFRLGNRWISPFSVAPWAEEKLAPQTPALLRALRGDFFCMPFGGNETLHGREHFPPHGETANANWKLEPSSTDLLHLSMKTSVRAGKVDKFIKLEKDQTALYSQHVISGMKGPMCFGHHPILLLPKAGSGRVSTSPIQFGQVCPRPFEKAEEGGYFALKTGAKFKSISRVPRVDGQWADLSVYPERDGYEDLVLMASETAPPFAWTAVTVAEEKYVWFALKDPKVLPSTIFWMSNGGRHYAPWSSRHRRCIGLEDVCAYFHFGLADSVKPNPLSRAGVPTFVTLDPKHALAVNYIMAVAAIPAGFDIVKTITTSKDGKSVTLLSASGKSVKTKLDVSFLQAKADRFQ